jgi:hypothetical protein
MGDSKIMKTETKAMPDIDNEFFKDYLQSFWNAGQSDHEGEIETVEQTKEWFEL